VTIAICSLVCHKLIEFLVPTRLSFTFGPTKANTLKSFQPRVIERRILSLDAILLFHTLLIHPGTKASILSIVLRHFTMIMNVLELTELAKPSLPRTSFTQRARGTSATARRQGTLLLSPCHRCRLWNRRCYRSSGCLRSSRIGSSRIGYWRCGCLRERLRKGIVNGRRIEWRRRRLHLHISC